MQHLTRPVEAAAVPAHSDMTPRAGDHKDHQPPRKRRASNHNQDRHPQTQQTHARAFWQSHGENENGKLLVCGTLYRYDYTEIDPQLLADIIKHTRVELLMHPLLDKYVQWEWLNQVREEVHILPRATRLGPITITYSIAQLVALDLLVYLAWFIPVIIQLLNREPLSYNLVEWSTAQLVVYVLVWSGWAYHMSLEVRELCLEGWMLYRKDYWNLVDLTISLTVPPPVDLGPSARRTQLCITFGAFAVLSDKLSKALIMLWYMITDAAAISAVLLFAVFCTGVTLNLLAMDDCEGQDGWWYARAAFFAVFGEDSTFSAKEDDEPI